MQRLPLMLWGAPQRILMVLVRGYRMILSPWLGSSCRFEPTCSAYSLQALEKHGAAVGTYITLHRLARCHPLCRGGHDPVPDHAPGPFSRLFHRRPTRVATLHSTLNDKTSP